MELLQLSPRAQLRAGRLPRRLGQLMVGLTLYGISMAFMVRAGLGMLPWDVFHYGLAQHLPLSLGTVVIVVSVLVLVLWIPLRQQPGLGTVANAVWIGVVLDVVLRVLPHPEQLAAQVLLMLAGIALNALATALYIGSQLGPGPRDGLMTGLSRRTGLSLRLVRTGLEIAVVVAGVVLGGVLGVGTVLYALLIGPLTQWLLPKVIVGLTPAGELGGVYSGV